MHFSPAHIVIAARTYESKVSSWDAEAIDRLGQLVTTRKLQMALA